MNLEFKHDRKRICNEQFVAQFPVPTLTSFGCTQWKVCEGYMNGKGEVVVKDSEQARLLYEHGYYGKIIPVDDHYHKSNHEKYQRQKTKKYLDLNGLQYENFKVTKRKENQEHRSDKFALPQGNVKLILSFEEAFFLSFVFGCLLVYDLQNSPLNIDQLWDYFKQKSQDFIVKYITYHHIRSKGIVARCGLNYGVPYVGYYKGMSFYHSTFMFAIHQVTCGADTNTSFKNPNQYDLCTLQRDASSVKKQLIVIKIQLPNDLNCEVTKFLENTKVDEIHVTRFVVETSPENLKKIEKWKELNAYKKLKFEKKRQSSVSEDQPNSSKKIKTS